MLFDPQSTFWRRQPLCFWLVGLGSLALTGGCERAKSAKDATPPPDVVVAEVAQRTVPIVPLYKALGGGWKE
jgi:hypothetical protein